MKVKFYKKANGLCFSFIYLNTFAHFCQFNEFTEYVLKVKNL